MNGFADSQLSYTDFIDNFIDKTIVADGSIDANANVSQKDIVTLLNEMSKPHQKLLGFNKIFHQLNKDYDFKTAKAWLNSEWDGHLYMHDAPTSSFFSYCYAYDLEDLVNKGLYFINNFNNTPPKHLTTYIDFVGEFISYCCNRTSGACGLPSFLVYAYYFWSRDVKENYYLKNPTYYAEQAIQEMVYRLNQPYLRQGIQSAFVNWSIFDRPYLEALFGGKQFPDGSFIIDEIEEIREFQKMAMRVVSKVRAENIMTFPVISYALLRQEKKFIDEEFARWATKHNMTWGDANFFISDSVTSLSNCCRLVNDIDELGFFNSIGGSALRVGSIKVNTINLARLAYESKTKQEYLIALKEQTELCLKALDCVRTIIFRNVEKGLLPNFEKDLINFQTCYNTIGILGLFETLQEFGLIKTDEFGYSSYTEEGLSFAQQIFKTIHTIKDAFALDKIYKINIEAVPGESAASKLMQKDKIFFDDKEYSLPLYGNQFIPLGVKSTLDEKIRVSAVLDQACNGGSISHINLDAPMTNFDNAWELLNKIADAGVMYFAFNLKINACKMNHGFYGETCPICGGAVETTYSRIVGFLVPVKTFSKERKEEFETRTWLKEDEL